MLIAQMRDAGRAIAKKIKLKKVENKTCGKK